MANLDEPTFWTHLEFRVCLELRGIDRPEIRGLWCDGFIPERCKLDEEEPRIVGWVWIGLGRRGMERWTFLLLLEPGSGKSREAMDWSSLLPADDVTRWLTVDRVEKTLVIEPGAAVPDGGS